MPGSYSVDKEQKLLRCTFWGRVTGAEGAKMQQEFMRDAEFRPDFNQIIDLTAVTDVAAQPAELRAMAIKAPFKQGSRRAVLVKSKVEYGVARMFQTYREIAGGGDEMRIFKDRDEALQWLLNP
jgi:hypothetical protein